MIPFLTIMITRKVVFNRGKKMNEQFMFYWFHWLFIIIAYFFMAKTRMRLFILIWIFCIIVCSPFHLTIMSGIQVSVSYIILFIGAFLLFAQFSFSVLEWLYIFTLMIGYVSLLIWEVITPVWFFISSILLIPFIISILTGFYIHSLKKQIALVTVSMAVGHAVFGFILVSYHLQTELIELTFFILLSMTITFLLTISIIRYLFVKMKLIQHY